MGMMFKTGQKLFVDTAPLIYWFEENPVYTSKMKSFFDEITTKHILLITSMVTYIEVLTYPEKQGARELVSSYREYLLDSEQIRIHPLDVSVADAAVRLRCLYSLRTPDAIQLATAQTCDCDFVLSNDKTWKKVAGMRVLLVQELGL